MFILCQIDNMGAISIEKRSMAFCSGLFVFGISSHVMPYFVVRGGS